MFSNVGGVKHDLNTRAPMSQTPPIAENGAGFLSRSSPIEFRREVLESSVNLPFECEHGEPQLGGEGFELVAVFLGFEELTKKISNSILDAAGGRHAAYSTSPSKLNKCNSCGIAWPENVEGLALGTERL